MTTQKEPGSALELPHLPAQHNDFISYITANPATSMRELLEPYKQYDAKLRQIFAQEPDHPATVNHQINTVPVFAGHEQEVKIRARNLLSETDEEKEQYIMPLKNTERKPNGFPAVVQSFKEFQTNFNLFCESSLTDMDWSNVVAAGSSVVTSLLPVPEQYNNSKRGL
ncbi:hypothetical protein LTR60_003045, partial [Cryomyces antarcticus]